MSLFENNTKADVGVARGNSGAPLHAVERQSDMNVGTDTFKEAGMNRNNAAISGRIISRGPSNIDPDNIDPHVAFAAAIRRGRRLGPVDIAMNITTAIVAGVGINNALPPGVALSFGEKQIQAVASTVGNSMLHEGIHSPYALWLAVLIAPSIFRGGKMIARLFSGREQGKVSA